jgi:hypothetical protein
LLVGAAGLNLVVLLGQLHGLVNSLYRDADFATPEVLAALSAGAGAGRVVNLGNHTYYEAWWLETATRGLAGHWQIWEAMPFVIAFIGIALIAWAAWRALGPFAALVTTTLMLSLGDAMRGILFTSDTHGYVVAHGALLAAAAVFLAERGRRGALSWPLLTAVALPLVAVSAVGATDQLFEFVFLPSFAIAGCLTWWRHPGLAQRQIAIFCVAVCGISILGAEMLNTLMRSEHVIGTFFPINFVASGALFKNLENTITSVAALGGGTFFGSPVAGTALLVFAIGVLALLGLAAVLRFLWQYARSLKTRASRAPLSLDLYLAFWSLVVVLSLAVYLLTTVAEKEGSERYLPGLYAGVAALLPALAARGRVPRTVVAVGVALFATLIATNHLITGTPPATSSPSPRVTYQILRFARSHGADHGYASNAVASVATWETHAALKAYPLATCGVNLCPMWASQISTWYRPQTDARTFLIGESGAAAHRNPWPPITSPPTAFGKAISTAKFGPYTVYIYGHDVAADLG